MHTKSLECFDFSELFEKPSIKYFELLLLLININVFNTYLFSVMVITTGSLDPLIIIKKHQYSLKTNNISGILRILISSG